MDNTRPGITAVAPTRSKKPMGTAKLALITVVISLSVGAILFTLITSLVLGSGSVIADDAKNLPHHTQARAITSTEYEAAEDFLAKPLSYVSDYRISYEDYQALPEDERETRIVSLDDKNINAKAFKEDVAKGTCTQEGDIVTCYTRLSEYAALKKKVLLAIKEASLMESQSSAVADAMVFTRDTVTGSIYGSNFKGSYDWESLYTIKYEPSSGTAIALTPGSDFPTRYDGFKQYNHNFFVTMRYFETGVEDAIKFELQAVDGQFYGLYDSPADKDVVPDSAKGIFHYNASARRWIRLTPGIDYDHSDDTGYVAAYKIAKDGCTLFYRIAGAYYSLKTCDT